MLFSEYISLQSTLQTFSDGFIIKSLKWHRNENVKRTLWLGNYLRGTVLWWRHCPLCAGGCTSVVMDSADLKAEVACSPPKVCPWPYTLGRIAANSLPSHKTTFHSKSLILKKVVRSVFIKRMWMEGMRIIFKSFSFFFFLYTVLKETLRDPGTIRLDRAQVPGSPGRKKSHLQNRHTHTGLTREWEMLVLRH